MWHRSEGRGRCRRCSGARRCATRPCPSVQSGDWVVAWDQEGRGLQRPAPRLAPCAASHLFSSRIKYPWETSGMVDRTILAPGAGSDQAGTSLPSTAPEPIWLRAAAASIPRSRHVKDFDSVQHRNTLAGPTLGAFCAHGPLLPMSRQRPFEESALPCMRCILPNDDHTLNNTAGLHSKRSMLIRM